MKSSAVLTAEQLQCSNTNIDNTRIVTMDACIINETCNLLYEYQQRFGKLNLKELLYDSNDNALDLTAPASDALLKNRKNAWVQLAGHPGAFAPAGPHTIWKKRLAKENTETVVYHRLHNEGLQTIAPKFYREVEYNQDFFIEMEDLLQHFHDPHVMDVKMGTRTFLESEVKNPALRKDLYDKMIKLDPKEPTAEEHKNQAITKLRYMQFRERGSSTSTLGFRIEATREPGEVPVTDLKKLKQLTEVQEFIAQFINFNHIVRNKLLARLKEIRHRIESSQFFQTHEIIGSSLLILYDHDNHAGVWLIDFAKTLSHSDLHLNHRSLWQLGNHEDGYLSGLDNLIEILEGIACYSEYNTTSSPSSSTLTVNSCTALSNNCSTTTPTPPPASPSTTHTDTSASDKTLKSRTTSATTTATTTTTTTHARDNNVIQCGNNRTAEHK